MTKIYRANTNVSINVVLSNQKNKHITFVPLSDGSSVFTTDCEELQQAIEKHYNFGKLFKLKEHNTVKRSKKHYAYRTLVTKNDDTEAVSGDETADVADSDSKNTNLRRIKVNDISEAKDYLAETFGISRTTMRSTKSILEKASANGVEFEGL